MARQVRRAKKRAGTRHKGEEDVDEAWEEGSDTTEKKSIENPMKIEREGTSMNGRGEMLPGDGRQREKE